MLFSQKQRQDEITMKQNNSGFFILSNPQQGNLMQVYAQQVGKLKKVTALRKQEISFLKDKDRFFFKHATFQEYVSPFID